jgi:metal-responsive CopG/Arc/MetJ family transcriptional regulator
MATQTINISLPKELVAKIDAAAKIEFASRSDYIRQALVSKLRADKIQADDWDVLVALSAEIAQNARTKGLASDKDFVQAVKETRADKLASQH